METPQAHNGNPREDEARLLATLERMLQLNTSNEQDLLNAAAQLVGEALGAEKVDLFMYHPENQTLQVSGLSATPMSRREMELGLDRIALADGGPLAEVFNTGAIFETGRAHEDSPLLRGVTRSLGVRSLLAVPLDIRGERRGVLQVASSREDAFSAQDRSFFLAVARWVGLVVHRAELAERQMAMATEAARRLAADEVITILAHDLGNLLSPISLRLQMLHRQAQQKRRTSESRDIQGILNLIERMQRLMMNLLDTAMLDQGPFVIEPETCDLAALVRTTAALLSLPQTPIEVRADQPALVAADPARLRQVIENLLGNALQHAPAATPISVSVAIERKRPVRNAMGGAGRGWATMIVENRGPGIPQELLPHLFERFTRGQSSLGSGLGLYVSHRIVEAHGGTLTAESKPGQGARFTMRLPLLANSDEEL